MMIRFKPFKSFKSFKSFMERTGGRSRIPNTGNDHVVPENGEDR